MKYVGLKTMQAMPVLFLMIVIAGSLIVACSNQTKFELHLQKWSAS